nr:hypothetical protein [Snodgrassella alvi]
MHYKGIMWLMLGILLTGCTAVNNQQPDKLVRQAIQQNITQYNQYNLSGEIKFRLDENKNTSAKEKQQDNISSVHDLETLSFVQKSKNTASDQKYISSEPSQHDDESMVEEGAEREHIQNKIRYDYLDINAKRTIIPFTGAVDLLKGRIEWIPEIYYKGPNIYSSTKFPTQIDFKDNVLTVDISAAQPDLNWFALVKAEMLDKSAGKPDFNNFALLYNKFKFGEKPYIAWNINENFFEKLPFKQLIRWLPKAIDDGIARLDKANYVFLDMDDKGRQLGAKYLVRLTTDDKQNKLVFKTLLDSINTQLKQQGWLEINTNNALPEKTNEINVNDLGKLIASATVAFSNIETADEDSEYDKKITNLSYNMIIDFYIDKNGRLMAIKFIKDNDHFYLKKTEEIIWEKMSVVTVWMQFQYNPNPYFIMKSTLQNTTYSDSKSKLNILFRMLSNRIYN